MRYPSLTTVRRIFSPSVILVLVLLMAVAAGGYYYWQTKKKVRFVSLEEVRAKLEEVKNNQNFTYEGGVFSYIIKNEQSNLLIVGQVENLENSILTLKQDQERILVRISPDVKIRILDLEHGPHELSGLDSLRKNLAIGDKVGVTEINFTEDDLPTTGVIIKIL